MVEQPVLEIAARKDPGSSASRKLRREGRIPAVLYGHGTPETISLDKHVFNMTVHPAHYGSLIVHLKMGARDAGTALVKGVQVNTLKHEVMSVDLLRVSMEEFIHISVPVLLTGEPAGAKLGGILEQALHSLNLNCRVSAVPEQIVYDLSALGIGDAIHASQLVLPADCELLDSPEEMIAVLLSPAVRIEAEAGAEEAVATPEVKSEG